MNKYKYFGEQVKRCSLIVYNNNKLEPFTCSTTDFLNQVSYVLRIKYDEIYSNFKNYNLEEYLMA